MINIEQTLVLLRLWTVFFNDADVNLSHAVEYDLFYN